MAGFQALADGTYKAYGLDVTHQPRVAHQQPLAADRRQAGFSATASTLQSFDAVANNVPLVAVAAMFRRIGGAADLYVGEGTENRGVQAADALGVEGRNDVLLPVAEVRIRL
jgi:hypothetical protein